MLKKICLVSVLILTGCTTASSGRLGELPKINSGDPSSKLVIIRVSTIVGGANSYYVSLDGKDIFSLRSGDYTSFYIPSGEHFIAVKCFGGWTPTWKEDSKSFTAKPKQTYYFEISPNFSCAEIVAIDDDKSRKLMTDGKFVAPDILSDRDENK